MFKILTATLTQNAPAHDNLEDALFSAAKYAAGHRDRVAVVVNENSEAEAVLIDTWVHLPGQDQEK